MDFDSCFLLVVGHEGGYTNDRNDRGNWTGGAVGSGDLKGTHWGISAASYPAIDIEGLTLAGAKALYWRDYWLPLSLEQLPEWLRYYLFDYAVNSGVGAAAEALQSAVGALRDGVIGPKTIIAAKAAPPVSVFRLLFVERALTYALDRNDRLYGRGWFARLFDATIRTHLDLNPMLGGRS